QDHPHGTLTLILGVSLGHNRYPSQKRKRHQTLYGSQHVHRPAVKLLSRFLGSMGVR
ncbi:hypothetical protein ABIB51_004518, partial [Arthrobacter sp. UYCu712]